MPKYPPRDLQRHWYDKLADEGFYDLEYRATTKKFLKPQYIRRPLSYIASRYQNETLDHYRSCENFLHDSRKVSELCRTVIKTMRNSKEMSQYTSSLAHLLTIYRRTRHLALLYSQGISLRKSIKILNSKYNLSISLTAAHYIIVEFKKRVREYNLRDPKGLFYEHERVNDLEIKPKKYTGKTDC